MSNKKTGNNFEQEFAETLSAAGYWVYIMPTKFGQPADIVAGKNGNISLYDCKDCQGGDFSLARVEANQNDSAELFEKCGCSQYFFAIRSGGKVYCVSYGRVQEAVKLGCRTLKVADLELMSRAVYECGGENL